MRGAGCAAAGPAGTLVGMSQLPPHRFSDDVLLLEAGARPVLWHRRTGRSFALSTHALDELRRWSPGLAPPPELEHLTRRLNQLSMLAESTLPDFTRMIPARSRLVLLLPELPALWLPLPDRRTAGGHAWAERRLSDEELALWRAMNGARTTEQVAHAASSSVRATLAFLAELTAPEVQAAQLRRAPVQGREPALARLISPERPIARRGPDQHGAEGQTTLDRYHVEQITDGDRHFDDRETTVAHAFALPHPALGGLTYGAALHRALETRGLLPDDGTVLEIGPGTGELGEAFLSRAADRGLPRGELVRLDRSPELLRTQRQRMPGTRELEGSATNIPLPDRSVALVLCNEVIADLAAVPFDPRDPLPGPAATAVRDRMDRYSIAPLEPGPTGPPLYNLGAWQLLEELDRVLVRGGAAFISEFGGLEEQPTETRFLDHPEVSIHFGHLVQVARALGFDAWCMPLAELLELDLRQRWLARHSYEGLRARMHAEGRHLKARAWTRDTVPLPWRVEGLEEVSLWEEGPAPVPTRFMALLLRKG